MNSEKLKKEIEKRIHIVNIVDPLPILIHLLSNHMKTKHISSNSVEVNYDEPIDR